MARRMSANARKVNKNTAYVDVYSLVACVLNLEHFVDRVYACPLSGPLFIFPAVFRVT